MPHATQQQISVDEALKAIRVIIAGHTESARRQAFKDVYHQIQAGLGDDVPPGDLLEMLEGWLQERMR